MPAYQHRQEDILPFMQHIYGLEKESGRKLKFLYHQSGIQSRYSVIPDYSCPVRQWQFYPPTENLEPFPSLEQRMSWFQRHAAPITVSCTGMSAPGLDLELVEALGLPPTVFRTSVNFMGCYAAVHALKLAHALAGTGPGMRILIVCTELCTLHFQQEPTLDNMLSSLLFADGSAAALVTSDDHPRKGLHLKHFYSEIITKGQPDMTWALSSTGFRMTLTSYVTDIIRADFAALVRNALGKSGIEQQDVSHWCIHPGGKKILDAIYKSLSFTNGHLDHSYAVLQQFGNMSSATLLFVLKRILEEPGDNQPNCIFGAAFGPGLTMETFIAESK